jgi:hypothetical protein
LAARGRLRRLARLRTDRRAERQHAAPPLPQHVAVTATRQRSTCWTANVANPFAGLLPGEGLNSTTTQRQQLLRPLPQFQDIQTWRYDGSSRYHAPQSRPERRFAQGYTVLFAYTYSRFTDRTYMLNFTDDAPTRPPPDADVPHRFAFSGILELPFGQGRRWGANAKPVVNALVGDWTITAIASIQSGRPIRLHRPGPQPVLRRRPGPLSASYSGDVNQPVFDSLGLLLRRRRGADRAASSIRSSSATIPRIRLANNVRYFPHRIGSLRSQALNEWQMSFVKRVPITARVRGQINIELLNAFNQTIYAAPAPTRPTPTRQGHQPVQPAAERPARLQAPVLTPTRRGGRRRGSTRVARRAGR